MALINIQGILVSAIAAISSWNSPPPQGVTVEVPAAIACTPTDKLCNRYVQHLFVKPRKATEWRSPLPLADRGPWIVSSVAWGECRNGGTRCMQATINVLFNRAKKNHTRPEDEALKPAQFSCRNANDPSHIRMAGIGRWINPHSPDGITWTIARGLSRRAYAHDLPDVTNGALWYHTKAIKAAWDKDMRKVATIGEHVYFVRRAA